MANPLYTMMSGTPQGNMPDVMQRFTQFRNTFQGDARTQVQSLLNSGKISQAQYNQAVQMANQLSRMMR